MGSLLQGVARIRGTTKPKAEDKEGILLQGAILATSLHIVGAVRVAITPKGTITGITAGVAEDTITAINGEMTPLV